MAGTKALSGTQLDALHTVLVGNVVRDQVTPGEPLVWRDLKTHTGLRSTTMNSLLRAGLVELQRDHGDRFWRRLVVITREGRMALGLPGVDLDEATSRLRLYLIQHDLRAAGTGQNTPSDTIHSMSRLVEGREVTEQLRASDIERVLDALDGHL